MRSGWVILGYDERQVKIQNSIIDLHDEHVPFLNIPLLVLDVWEHAYTLDYGINKAAYLDAFISNIDWDMVSKKTRQCLYSRHLLKLFYNPSTTN
ncbi:MAG: Fe-Mn family superoxide dismutase [Candidatus Melainabacteria bacterium]|nr:MAG: Fe-Mn family superoxide dismutase [Candidatus Melainabacteria bacterium]